MSKTYAHEEVCNSDVRAAFVVAFGNKAGGAKAGRVVSGLLKAAEKAGKIKARHTHGRASGCLVWEMTDEQLAAIRSEAISRAAKPAHRRLCTPMSIEQAATLMATT